MQPILVAGRQSGRPITIGKKVKYKNQNQNIEMLHIFNDVLWC